MNESSPKWVVSASQWSCEVEKSNKVAFLLVFAKMRTLICAAQALKDKTQQETD